MIERAVVQRISGDTVTWLSPLSASAITHEIDTPQRERMWLAQCAHESQGFTRLVENLRYSAAALRRTWPHRFSEQDAQKMQYDEVRIGERAYGGRYGNRPEGSGDGYKYRGRGCIGITFVDNYRACGEAMGADLLTRPELLERPQFAAWSAGWFWKRAGCNELADRDDFEGVTRAINGGTIGLDDRVAWYEQIGRTG
jgi:putative chitinase